MFWTELLSSTVALIFALFIGHFCENHLFWFSWSNQVIYVNYQLSEEAIDILRCESSSSSGNLVISWPRKASRTPQEATFWTFLERDKVIMCTNCQHRYYLHLNYGAKSIQKKIAKFAQKYTICSLCVSLQAPCVIIGPESDHWLCLSVTP